MSRKETSAAPEGGAQDERGNSIVIRGPRQWRVLRRLMVGPLRREELDTVAGASNGPALVAILRARGLDVECLMVPHIDKDGKRCRRGVYSLAAESRERIRAFLEQRAARRRQS